MFFETLLFITLTALFVFLLNCNIVYVRHRWSALSPFNFYIFLNVIIFLDFYFFIISVIHRFSSKVFTFPMMISFWDFISIFIVILC